jgi:hypothetical protein
MASKACAELFNERRSEMQNDSDDTLRFKRTMKRAFIFLAVVEFVVTAVGLFYYVNK